jgi:hypothetical protein
MYPSVLMIWIIVATHLDTPKNTGFVNKPLNIYDNGNGTYGLNVRDLVRNTAIGGNVDTDKFIQFIKIAQEIHIQNYTGTKLYDKISNDIIAGTLNKPLLGVGFTTTLQPMLIHFANG